MFHPPNALKLMQTLAAYGDCLKKLGMEKEAIAALKEVSRFLYPVQCYDQTSV